MKHSLFALLLFSTNLYSAADEPHPIIDSNYISKYSYNIENMDLNELKNTQKALKNHLNKTNYYSVVETSSSFILNLANGHPTEQYLKTEK